MRRLARALPFVAALTVLLAALYLVSGVEESTQLGRLSLWVFLITGVALVVLAGVIAGRLIGLVRNLRRNRPGSRLTARLVAVFVALALPPVVIVYLFSVEFLSETIDGWFDVQTGQALEDSVALGRMLIDIRTREVTVQLARLAGELQGLDEDGQFGELIRHVSAAGPTELTVLDSSGQSRAFAHIDSGVLLPDPPAAFALTQALQTGEYAVAEPAANGRLAVRALRLIPAGGPGAPQRVLQGIYPLPDEFAELAASIESAYYRYDNVAYLRNRLKQTFVLILSLVLLLTGLLAMLLAFNAARRLVAPVRDLAQATEEMAAGRFPRELPVATRDELGFLVRSFNIMTHELASSQRQLEAQRSYLETVLGRLSSGVIAVAAGGRLQAFNDSAARILGLDLEPFRGRHLSALGTHRADLAPLAEAVLKRLHTPGGEWRREIKLGTDDVPLVLVCRGSALPDESGHVLVFDDVTVLDQAQREAAWAEVARRLAHEVKNPLTPIRLSAERLRLKLAGAVTEEQRALVEKTTATIINQVDALKRLVDAFGDYARAPALRRAPVDLKALISEVLDLYKAGDDGMRFQVSLPAVPLMLIADADRLRQVLHNLFRNASEAAPGGSPVIELAVRAITLDGRAGLEIEIADNGPGFAPAVLDRLFEPHVSTKPRGTGLGLPIVRRIIDEHGGSIDAGNRPGGGARVIIRLPR